MASRLERKATKKVAQSRGAKTMPASVATAEAKQAASERVAAADLQSALLKHTRASNRGRVLKTLREARFLSNIALDSTATGDIEASEREVSTDTIKLNGLTFFGKSERPSRFLETLQTVCDQLCRPGQNSGGGPRSGGRGDDDDFSAATDPRDVYEGLIFRMTRSACAADSYFKLNALLGSADLILMPRKERPADTPPVEVELMSVPQGGGGGGGVAGPGGTGGVVVHATVSCPNVYGLFRKGDLKKNFGKAQPMPYEAGRDPWISIDAIVEERVNFASGQSVRYLRVKAL